MQNPTNKAVPVGQIPVTTLGRSGLINDNRSLLDDKMEKLDALLCLISLSPSDVDGENDFQSLGQQLQLQVLRLASDLAGEVHELHTITRTQGAAA